MPYGEFRVMTRGEVDDDTIARYLDSDMTGVKIIKLHGDLISQSLIMKREETLSFSPMLADALTRLFQNDAIIVGHQLQDTDIVNVLTKIDRGSLYYVNPNTPPSGSFADTLIKNRTTVFISGLEGNHDNFFAQLNFAVQQKMSATNVETKREIEKSILERQERGRGYLNYKTYIDLIEQFSKKILSYSPDLIFFVYDNDPAAPGGMELKKEMTRYLKGIEIETVEVSGESGSRVFRRRVHESEQTSSEVVSTSFHNIFVLDVIAFSGKTLGLACNWVREKYPNSVVRSGSLIVSQELLSNLNDFHSLHDIIYVHTTDRHEIFFPWGIAYTTGEFEKKFKEIEGIRIVKVSKRPWGTIEILADEEYCSVRILTIEADEKLSFQRHLCRDELFVALDDFIGLDISGENLEQPFDQFDPRVKSIVLEKGDYVYVPRGVWHRTKASKDRARLLEVAFGLYDQVNDIERLEDKFNRVGADGSE